MSETPLSKFVWLEIVNRRLSQREFADLVGVSHTTIGRIVRGEVADPTLDFLVKLSKATSTDICALIAIIRPDAFQSGANTRLVAERYERLSDAQRKLVDLVLSGSMIEGDDKGKH